MPQSQIFKTLAFCLLIVLLAITALSFQVKITSFSANKALLYTDVPAFFYVAIPPILSLLLYRSAWHFFFTLFLSTVFTSGIMAVSAAELAYSKKISGHVPFVHLISLPIIYGSLIALIASPMIIKVKNISSLNKKTIESKTTVH
jgi:hypothetical protein